MILPALHMCDYKTLVKVLVWEVYGAKSIKQGEKTLSRCHFSILKQRIMCSLHSSHLWNADVQFCIYCVKNDLPITLTLLIWESTNFNQLSLPLIPSDVLKQEHSSGFYNRDSADHRIKITTYFKFAMPFFFFFLGCSQSWRDLWFNSNKYVCYNKVPIQASIMPLRLPSVLIRSLEEHMWSQLYSTSPHCSQLGRVSWTEISRLAEILPLNPELIVKARRRLIMLSFFCSLLKQRHNRLFYKTLSTVCMH